MARLKEDKKEFWDEARDKIKKLMNQEEALKY